MADITTGLTHYWRFDGNLGASIGGADFTGTATYEAGVIGQRAIVAGGQQLAVSDNTVTDVGASDSFSVALWYRAATYGQQFLAYKKADVATTTAGWLLIANGNGSVNGMVVDTGQRRAFMLSSAGLLTSNTNYHIVLTFDRATPAMILYVNGAVVDSTPTFDGAGAPSTLNDITTLTNTQTLKFKRAADANDARVDELRFYGRALSAADVAALYAFTGAAFKPLSQGRLSGIIGQPLRGKM